MKYPFLVGLVCGFLFIQVVLFVYCVGGISLISFITGMNGGILPVDEIEERVFSSIEEDKGISEGHWLFGYISFVVGVVLFFGFWFNWLGLQLQFFSFLSLPISVLYILFSFVLLFVLWRKFK